MPVYGKRKRSSYSRAKQPPANRGPSGVQKSYASQLKERDALFNAYEHLQGLQRDDFALSMLRKVASLVKPIMRKRNWKVSVLAEFLPPEQNLLGLNINRGSKICLRLRYHRHPDLFLPAEEVVDTMLHELSHIIWSEHDSNFHRLWDELRDEHDVLVRKGYTGEGFLSEGHRLGGGRPPPANEIRRLARDSAQNRQNNATLTKGSEQRLGGAPLLRRGDKARQVIADQIIRRNTINKACGSGRQDAIKLSDLGDQSFTTKADEDDANDRAIAQALYDLMIEEEESKLKGTFSEAPSDGGLAWHPENGLYNPVTEPRPTSNTSEATHPTEDEQLKWAMQESTRLTLTANSRPTFNRTTSAPGMTPTMRYPRDSTPQRQFRSTITDPVDLVSPTAPPPTASASTPSSPTPLIDLSEPFDPDASRTDNWTCDVCTCINPLAYLACDACGSEKPAPRPRPNTYSAVGMGAAGHARAPERPRIAGGASVFAIGASTRQYDPGLEWNCVGCGAFMEHRWWTCSGCGRMKESS